MIYMMTSEHAAWRAFYLYIGGSKRVGGYKFFHLGIDPVHDGWAKPNVFGSIFGWQWRINLPTLKFMTAFRHKQLMPLWIAQQKFLNSLDGRNFYYQQQRQARQVK
jgi:hypothetical protein